MCASPYATLGGSAEFWRGHLETNGLGYNLQNCNTTIKWQTSFFGENRPRQGSALPVEVVYYEHTFQKL